MLMLDGSINKSLVGATRGKYLLKNFVINCIANISIASRFLRQEGIVFINTERCIPSWKVFRQLHVQLTIFLNPIHL